MRRDFLALVGGVMASVIAATAGDVAEAQEVGPRRIDIQYVAPTNALHLPTYQEAMSGRVLEKLQEFFSPLRLPRRLLLKLEGCDGVSNAWYENDVVSVCYEYIYDATVAARKRSRPASLDERDVIAGAFFDVFLHEVAHAVFDFLNLPVLGREEDAADQVAAYVMLSFGKEEAVRLTTAAMYLYAGEAGASTVRHFKRLRTKTGNADFSDVHGTPAQRLYNLMCIAYGADPQAFAMTVESGALPADRADGCAEEYQQIATAYDQLIRPHLDPVLAKAVTQQQWLAPRKR